MRMMPDGFILPVIVVSLETILSGQVGLNVPVVSVTLTEPQTNALPLALSATMSFLPSAAICLLE